MLAKRGFSEDVIYPLFEYMNSYKCLAGFLESYNLIS